MGRLEATSRTRRRMARAASRGSDEEMRSVSSRFMLLGAREREVVLSRW